MDIPKVKISNGVLIGIAVGAALLAIVLFYENQNMRKQLVQTVSGKKPCGCNENQVNEVAHASAQIATDRIAGVHESVITGRLNSQPMPAQHPHDPEHPPEVVL
jgi:hypothetical protein